MTEFEHHPLPANGDLIPLLRDLGSKVFVEERRDSGDQSAWDWTRRLYESHADWRDRIDDAFAHLLTAEDPFPQMVLEQVTKLPVRSFLPRLLDVISKHASALRRPDPYRSNGQSILGSTVRAAASMSRATAPAGAALSVLSSIDRREDGWPESFRLAFAGDPHSLSGGVVAALQQMNADERQAFVRGAIADGPPWTVEGLEAISRAPASLRDEVGTIVRVFDEELESSKSALANLDVSDDPEMKAYVDAALKRKNPWPEHAARLGIQP